MRIRVVKTPPLGEVDGIRLDQFRPVAEYRLSNGLGALFLAEGWGEPADEDSLGTPGAVFRGETVSHPPNLLRERYPPYYDSTPTIERRRTRRRR